MSDLANSVTNSPSRISQRIDRLSRDGLVERSRESADRRLVTVRLTEDGAGRLVEAYRKQNVVEQDFFGALTEPERRDLVTRLGSLLSHPRADPETPEI